jgi:GT2 family glycosyltransferase
MALHRGTNLLRFIKSFFFERLRVPRELRQTVEASGLFDPEWYVRNNPDVAKAGVDPLSHFLRFGDAEGRPPGPRFDSHSYAAAWPDVAASGLGPLEHFLRIGHAAGRSNPKLRSASNLRLCGDTLVGAWPGTARGTLLALLIDGALTATCRSGPGGSFSFSLPQHTLGTFAEVLDVATNRPMLTEPFAISTTQAISWHGWSCEQGWISGAFRVPQGSRWAADQPLLVQAVSDGALFMRTFALPDKDGVFRFRGAGRRLLRPTESLEILPVVAGIRLDEPLTITPALMGALGYLDLSSPDEAIGWVAPIGDTGRRIEIEIRVDHELAGATRADIERQDVRELGLSNGPSGFRLPIPPGMRKFEESILQAFIAGTETELIESPRVLPPRPPIVGSFDHIAGNCLMGWVLNHASPQTPLTVEALCENEVIAAGVADRLRDDVAKAGLPNAHCGFRITLQRPLAAMLNKDIYVRDTLSKINLSGSPRRIDQNDVLVRFLTRTNTIKPAVRQRLARRMTAETTGIIITIIMPVYNTRQDWLIEALNSVTGQWSAGWELICVDDGSTQPHVLAVLEAARRRDSRIRVIQSPFNVGIGRAVNLGIQAAQGDYVAFMDHDDVLEPDAVHKLARAALTTGAELIYSDEVLVGEDMGLVLEVRARPAFSYDYYLSHPYFVHMVAVRTALARALNGWDERLTISNDIDFVLRVIERAVAVAHVPAVLYRWRTHTASAGHRKAAEVMETMTGILNRHLERLGLTKAKASRGLGFNEFRIDWEDDGGEVLIVIPTRNRADLLRPCIESIERTADGANCRILVVDHESTDADTLDYLQVISKRHSVMPYEGIFNYAKINNAAVRAHGGNAKYLLFLNNDIEAISLGWIQRLRSLAARPEVGIAGPLLLYPDGLVQHAGVLMGFHGAAEHVGKFVAAYDETGDRNNGYNCILTSVRDYSAVTAACMLARHDVFREVGGFDENFVVGFNDTDLCLRIREAGYKVLFDGHTVLFHHESQTRLESASLAHPEDDERLRSRWRAFFKEGDPFYSPLLQLNGADHTLRADNPCPTNLNPRVVELKRADLG